MPFITQGKTNCKFLVIVIILAVIVGGGALWLSMRQKVSPTVAFKKPEEVVISPQVNLKTTKLATLPGEYVMPDNKGNLPLGIDVIEIAFSPDGYKVAYVSVDTNEKEGKDDLFINEQKIDTYDRIYNLTFSPDGKQFVYFKANITPTGRSDEFVVVNGKEGKHYNRIDETEITFSPDSQKLAYVGCETDKCYLVINGVEEKNYSLVKGKSSSISWLIFSPDSQKLAYVISNEEGYSLIIDGKEVAKYPSNYSDYTWLTHLGFSPDSQKLAYTVCSEKAVSSIWEGGYECYPVVNGEKWKTYSQIYEGPVFSADSKNIAFATGNCIILNDEEKCYWGATMYLIFSPNSKRFVYDATTGIGEGGLVINGKVEKIDFVFEPLSFSPDNNLLVGYGDRQLILLKLDEDGIKATEKGKSYESVFTNTTKFTSDGKYITYGAELSNELWWIVDEVAKFGQ